MDDSDEYFDESFVLDEHALARIDEIETHFISTQKSTSDVSNSSNNPTYEVASATVSHKSATFNELKKNKSSVVSRLTDPFENDLFDLNVRVGPNGTYVFAGGSNERADCNDQKSVQVPTGGHQAGSITSVHEGKRDFEVELADMHAHLAKLKESNDLMRRSLREAQEAQVIKTGEVAILRSTVEKQKQEYLDMVSKAKTERIAFEKTKADLQAKIKEETDRLSTNFAFRLQELQTSTRKQIRSSARSSRIARNTQYDGTETPLRASRSFNPPAVKENIDNDSDQEAPSSSPSRPLSNRRRALEKKAQFRKFQNAFTQSASVIKSPVKNVHNPSSSSAGGSKILVQDTFIHNDDTMLIDQEDVVFESPVREFAAELPPDPSSAEVRTSPLEEFQRTIFSHVAPDSDDLTLHSLLSVSFSVVDITSNLDQVYASACSLLLKCCSGTVTPHHSQRTWENSAGKIAGVFVTLGNILFREKILDRLFALLDLLLQLTLIIPSISTHLLRPTINPLLEDFPEFEQGNLMTLFCDIIQTHLIPSPDSQPFGKRYLTHTLHHNLTMTILNLLGSLYWHKAEGDSKLDFLIIFKSRALQTLLLASQGRAVIKRTLQLLILWASDERLVDLFQYQEEASMTDSSSEAVVVSIVNQISAFLTDIIDPQLYDLLHLTFTLINTLSYIRHDIRSSLLESLYLLPSAIICITTLTRGLWEEKPEIVSDMEVAESSLNLLFTAVSSLHHLLFYPETYSNFSLQLMKSTGISRKFNGVVHMFIVTFGRLSWAGAPEWLPPKARSLCETISEFSMELIETVVPGPECDSLWSVWHESDPMEDQDV